MAAMKENRDQVARASKHGLKGGRSGLLGFVLIIVLILLVAGRL
jgi:hypothetical protein